MGRVTKREKMKCVASTKGVRGKEARKRKYRACIARMARN